MQDWKFLGRYAVTDYPTNLYREYVVVGKNVVGYAELNDDQTWSYYQFAPQEKGVTTPPEPIFKSTGSTPTDAVTKGMQ